MTDKKNKSLRYSFESLKTNSTDNEGPLFLHSEGFTDLSAVKIYGASVDTVRQIFFGLPRKEVIDKVDILLESRDTFISLPFLDGDQLFHFSRMGKASQYRYKFQNNDLGVVILFCSFNNKTDIQASHLKIELSPHFINTRSVKNISEFLHGEHVGFSRLFLHDPKPNGCAIHLACDYSGFRLPDDFIFKFKTYSRTIKAYDGLNQIDLSDISDAVCTYGSKHLAKNYLIGKVTATQVCLYDKTTEAIKSDKIDYFHDQWKKYTGFAVEKNVTVRRIELRFHQQIIREIGNGIDKELEFFSQIVPYLTDVWRYGLKRNRLLLDENQQAIHPFWQLLIEDVTFHVPATGLPIKRVKKTSVEPMGRDLMQAVGLIVKQYARKNFTLKRAMSNLRTFVFYPDLLDYKKSRGETESDLIQYVNKRMIEHRLVGKVA